MISLDPDASLFGGDTGAAHVVRAATRRACRLTEVQRSGGAAEFSV
jgi:hypothetical protein